MKYEVILPYKNLLGKETLSNFAKLSLFMSPVSPVFHTMVTVRIAPNSIGNKLFPKPFIGF